MKTLIIYLTIGWIWRLIVLFICRSHYQSMRESFKWITDKNFLLGQLIDIVIWPINVIFTIIILFVASDGIINKIFDYMHNDFKDDFKK